MVTLEQLQNSTCDLHYTGKHDCAEITGPRGGKTYVCTTVRRSGQIKTWKTRPGEFHMPVKYGMWEHGYVDHHNAKDWHLSSECPVEALRYG